MRSGSAAGRREGARIGSKFDRLNRTRWSLVVAVASIAGLGLWLLFTPKGQHTARTERGAVSAERREAPSRAVAPPEPPVRSSPTTSAAPSTQKPLNVVGPGPDDPHEPGMVPHPLDDARARLDTLNRVQQALNDAMSFRKVKEMRELLVAYQKLDPQDIDKSQLGYSVIADCIEFPGERSLAAARHFYDSQRHSPLRRFVRRICFENKN